MNYLKKGLSGSLKAIRERKRLFVLLVILQLIFVVLVIGLSIYFQVKIFADAQGIIEPLQNANYGADSIEAGEPFTEDMVNIYNSYTSMKHNIIVFLSLLMGLYLVLNGSIWILTHGLLRNINLKDYKKIFGAWLKFTASILLIMGPFLLVSYYLLISLLKVEAVESFSSAVNILMYVLLAIYYLILASFVFIHKRSWKSFAVTAFNTSIKNIFRSLSVLFVNLAALFASGYLVYFTVNGDESFSLLVLSSILFILSLVVTRIFWIASLKEVAHEKDNPGH